MARKEKSKAAEAWKKKEEGDARMKGSAGLERGNLAEEKRQAQMLEVASRSEVQADQVQREIPAARVEAEVVSAKARALEAGEGEGEKAAAEASCKGSQGEG